MAAERKRAKSHAEPASEARAHRHSAPPPGIDDSTALALAREEVFAATREAERAAIEAEEEQARVERSAWEAEQSGAAEQKRAEEAVRRAGERVNGAAAAASAAAARGE
jgi:hypothetical protein